MKTLSTLRQILICTVLLFGAFSAAALTLGRVRGAALIGRPLDVVIQMGVDAGDDVASICAEADVFQGDFRIDGGRVTAQLIPGTSAREMGVRVRTSVAIDEPVVTVYLRVGCSEKVTRRYVLLADIPAEVAPPVANLPMVAAPVVPAAPTAASKPAAVAPLAPNAGTAKPAALAAASGVPPVPLPLAPLKIEKPVAPDIVEKSPQVDKRVRPERPFKAEKSGRTEKALQAEKPVRSKSQARLKLEPLDLSIERDPVLRASGQLLSTPTADEASRKQAAALWQAINAQPLDVLRDAQRLEALQTEFVALQRVNSANTAALADVRKQLQVAKDERYANGLVYSLVGLLLALAGLVGYLWHRWRRVGAQSPDWWQSPEPFRGVPQERTLAPKPSTELATDTVVEAGDSVADVDLGLNESAKLPLPPEADVITSRSPGPSSDFAGSMLGSPRAVNVEELFDIQQQADFFVSLEQHDKAIEVLRNHISENVETSALAYLDLLKIYHATEKPAEYARLRDDFNKVFNAQVPQFDAFTDKGSGLEMYQNALARVEALWPSPKVLEIIEESIFRKPGQGGEAFDLEAYRELLLLYAIAKDIVEQGEDSAPVVSLPSAGGSVRPNFSDTSIQPLSTEPRKASASATSDAPAEEVLPNLEAPWVSPRLALDIDLSDPFTPTSVYPEIGSEASDSGHPASSKPPASRTAASPDNNLIDFDMFDIGTASANSPKREGET